MQLLFSGHTALVLGASSQIGLDLTRMLLDKGLCPVPAHASEQGQAAIAAHFPDLPSPRLDLTDPATFASLQPKLNNIDYLVDLAQADQEGLLAATNTAEAERYFAAHVAGRFALLKTLTRSMLARRFGRLLHVSSTAAALPAPGQGCYGAAKNAAESLYLSLGLELGARGITSLSLRLGLVDAGRGARFLDQADRRHLLADTILQAKDVAATLCFLLSDQARAITCTTITMDAGLTAKKYL